MKIRIDKCSSFGMMKRNKQYIQIQPALFINNVQIPSTTLGESFVYLGKTFDFEMDNSHVKAKLLSRVKDMLLIITNLRVRPQLRLKILRQYVPSQISFELKTYDISLTWIEQNLDSFICASVRQWLDLPISTCVAEVMSLTPNKGGLGIKSIKATAESLRLGQRHRLKNSSHSEMSDLWAETSTKSVVLDSIVNAHPSNYDAAIKALNKEREDDGWCHMQSLSLQGTLISAVSVALSKSAINKWSAQINKLSASLFKFVRKALQQQLPTAGNLKRWGKTMDPLCPLCAKIQTNKHVLSNCSSVVALDRYKSRHDAVLSLLAEWIVLSLKLGQTLHVDLTSDQYKPIGDIFLSLRPDIVIVDTECKKVTTLELTICHETNFEKSRQFKAGKYSNLSENLMENYSCFKIVSYTIEVSTLGFITNLKDFCCITLNACKCLPESTCSKIITSVIANSFKVYCKRNDKEAPL
jgi:zinc-binding in reverse transcriptase